MNNKKYTPVIGLEVHVELKTKSKMFCGCSTEYFGKEPNTHTCPVCLGLPGALPVPNQRAIEWCVMIGIALNCGIPLVSKFDRKNYFYPDLPKGYQISQYDQPFCIGGYVILNLFRHDKGKKIRIRRVHMEEDTGKLIHGIVNGENVSLIDFNRSGAPLVEIVTEPDFESAAQVKEYLQKLQQIVRYLGVSDADMEKGEMRLEPNISLQKNPPPSAPPLIKWVGGISLPRYKVEIKNINSFKFVEKAINYELQRQEEILNEGEIPVQETRGWDEKKQKTYSQRIKEEAADYRYFPEPDIPPITWTKEKIGELRVSLPELRDQKIERFQGEYGLPYQIAEILARKKSMADYFEEAVIKNHGKITLKDLANWIINKNIDITKTTPADLIKQIVSARSTFQINESELEKVIKDVLGENAKAVEDYKKGKQTSIMFLVGQTMRKLGKKVDATMVRGRIEKELK